MKTKNNNTPQKSVAEKYSASPKSPNIPNLEPKKSYIKRLFCCFAPVKNNTNNTFNPATPPMADLSFSNEQIIALTNFFLVLHDIVYSTTSISAALQPVEIENIQRISLNYFNQLSSAQQMQVLNAKQTSAHPFSLHQ